jgi:hypothetical protein
MTAGVNPTPLSVDYTSRDYYALRNDLITRMKSRLSDWTGDDPADFGLAIIESFAYMGDLINYYIDRVANESLIGTATQRQSIINIAKTYGYSPSGYRAAYIGVEFSNSGTVAYLVPKGTQLTANVAYNDSVVQVLFTTLSDATVLPGDITEVQAIQAEDISTRVENYDANLSGERLGASDGQPDQQFTLSENRVVDDSVEVWVKNGNVYEKWTSVTHLTDYGPKDSVYHLTTDSNNYVCVNFGDGISGAIPPKDSVIRAVYNKGGGVVGNIPERSVLDIHQLFDVDVNLEYEIRTYVTAAASSKGAGGTDPEDNDSIRKNAPRLLTALNRAVSLKDFGTLALAVSNVGKASSDAAIWNSVTVYIAPQQTSTSSDLYPGYNGTPNVIGNLTPSFLAMQEAVKSYLSDKVQIGASVTVSPPTYVPVATTIEYTKKPGYTAEKVEANIRYAIANTFSYNDIEFGQVISAEEVESRLRYTDGVATLRLKYLYRLASGVMSRSVLVGAKNEIFSFSDGDVTIDELSSDSLLAATTGLVSSTGALNPAFVPTFYNYNITSTTATITLTPTSATAGQIITVNGTVATSGSAVTINTPTGLTVVTVTVLAADGITNTTYVVNITR